MTIGKRRSLLVAAFERLLDSSTEMRDYLSFVAPLPILGPVAEQLFLRSYMERFLRHRNEVLKQVAESDRWSSFLPGT